MDEHHLTLTDLLQQRTTRELRVLLTARGLSTHGNKHCMLWRLLRFCGHIPLDAPAPTAADHHTVRALRLLLTAQD